MRTPVDARALAASLRRLQTADERHGPSVVGRSLEQVAGSCVELFGVACSGIMLTDEHAELRVVTAVGAGCGVLENAQAATGQGPCIDTVLDGKPVASASVLRDERWPALAAHLDGGDLESVLAVPLRLSDVVVGSLNVAGGGVRDWSDDEQNALERYAELAQSVLATAISAEQAGELADQLTVAVAHRAAIDRGVGYLMARDGVDRPTAFHRLRLAARSSRRRIAGVADDLLDTGRLPGEPR